MNDGTLFGLKWVPTTVVQYIRPDALRFTSHLPLRRLPAAGPPLQRRAVRPRRLHEQPARLHAAAHDPGRSSASWALLADPSAARPAPGWRRCGAPRSAPWPAALTILPFAYIANRYLADRSPLLVVASLVGVHVVLRPHHRRELARPRWVAARRATSAVAPAARRAVDQRVASG